MRTVQQNYKIVIEELHIDYPNAKFNELLMEAVDEGLNLIGESAKQSLYFHLKKEFGIDKNDIPVRVEEFAAALEAIFGLGSKIKFY